MTPAGFAPEALDALGGPAWLVARRQEALARAAKAELPSEAEEEWHYSNVGALDLDAFAPPSPAVATLGEAGGLPPPATRLLEAFGQVAAVAVTVDGVVAEVRLEAGAPEGLRVGRLLDASSAPAGLAPLEEGADALSLVAEACVRDGVQVEVAPRTVVPAPIVLLHVVTDAASGRLVAPRTLVELGSEAEATVVELLVSGEGEALVASASELVVGAGGQLAHLAAQELGGRALQLGSHRARLARDASLTSFVAALGGATARQRTHAVLAGENAESRLFAAYLADGRQVLSFRTVQEHIAPRTVSELVFKGAVAGEARSAYSGLVHLHHGARRADASQTNRNLVLSEGARADSVPNLDIEENDVRCSHASAVGPIDAEQRFYLESRGVPPAAAERLVLLGFFEEILARSPNAAFAAQVRDALPGRLAAATGGQADATGGAGGAPARTS